MKECLKGIILAGATATLVALSNTGCVATTEVSTRPWCAEEPMVVERFYPLGPPVIVYRVYPHYGFHNPHTHFQEIPHFSHGESPRYAPRTPMGLHGHR